MSELSEANIRDEIYRLGDSLFSRGLTFGSVPQLKAGGAIQAQRASDSIFLFGSARALFDHFEGEGKTPLKEILAPIIVVSQKNLDEALPTIKQTVFANELKK